MANIGHLMTGEEVIGYILAGLDPGHGDLFTAITMLGNQRAVTLPEFYSYRIAHETQASPVNSTTTEFMSFTNNVARQDSNGHRRNFNGQNSHNSKNNNYRNNSFRNNGGGCGRRRGRGRYNDGPRCQVCGIPCHVALNCINRFNHAYQLEEIQYGNNVTTGNYNHDPHRYLDCGTTDHLTSDLDRMTV
ncbi:uncharacterized protein LOC111920875 [Lactuca sativa]|uniref:uncharacterized protein LOC111920875 n=1 Tax=Lactuca sativa TaxID=4236 RepID=UPI000CD9CC19|nr:uncharacterized protein LOC111920875 [Lactuca sativa]